MTKEEFDNEPSTTEELTKEEKDEKLSEAFEEKYEFGWSSYSEITNGRFAMIGFVAIILIELFSQQSFIKWAGIL